MTPPCPLCRSDKKMHKAKPLYGKFVCKKCYYKFANRRQFAYLIDTIILYVVQVVIYSFVIGLAVSGQITTETYQLMYWSILVFFVLVFLLKDGIGGVTPGRAICGVQVVDAQDYTPIGFGHSFKRNLPLLIPFAVLVVAGQLCRGFRLGDPWARTKVIWRKYRDHHVFTGEEVKTPETPDVFLPGDDRQAADPNNPFSPPTA